MLSIVYLMLFLSGGAVIARLLLPRLKPVLRVYLGLSLGCLLSTSQGPLYRAGKPPCRQKSGDGQPPIPQKALRPVR